MNKGNYKAGIIYTIKGKAGASSAKMLDLIEYLKTQFSKNCQVSIKSVNRHFVDYNAAEKTSKANTYYSVSQLEGAARALNYELFKAAGDNTENMRFFHLTDKSGACELKITKGDILAVYPEFKKMSEQAAAAEQAEKDEQSEQAEQAAEKGEQAAADITEQLIDLIQSGAPFDIAAVKAALAKVEQSRKAEKVKINKKGAKK